MAGKPKRLSKVTKEFNLGLSTVVDFLQEKGFEVESNPNAKISPEMYDVLSGEFQTEKKVKEKSKNIEVKKPITEVISIEEEKPKPEPVIKAPEPVIEVKQPAKEELKESPKEVQSEDKKPAKLVEKVSEEKTGLKVLGKIDLGQDKKRKPQNSKKKMCQIRRL